MPQVLGIQFNPNLSAFTRLLGPPVSGLVSLDPRVVPLVPVSTMTGSFLELAGGFGYAADPHGIAMALDMERPPVIDVSISRTTGWSVGLQGLGVALTAVQRAALKGEGLSDPDRVCLAILNRHYHFARERTLAALLFNTGTFATYTAALAAGVRWDTAGGDPVADAETAKASIGLQSGDDSGIGVLLGFNAWKALRNNSVIRTYASRGSAAPIVGPIPDAKIAEALGVDFVVVGKAGLNSAREGQTVTPARLWGSYALFFRNQPTPIPETPQTCIARFGLEGYTEPSANSYDLPGGYKKQTDLFQVDQFAVPLPRGGYLFSTVAA